MNFWVPKMRFPKCTFSGPQLSRRGLVWYLHNSSKAHAPRRRPAAALLRAGLITLIKPPLPVRLHSLTFP